MLCRSKRGTATCWLFCFVYDVNRDSTALGVCVYIHWCVTSVFQLKKYLYINFLSLFCLFEIKNRKNWVVKIKEENFFCLHVESVVVYIRVGLLAAGYRALSLSFSTYKYYITTTTYIALEKSRVHSNLLYYIYIDV